MTSRGSRSGFRGAWAACALALIALSMVACTVAEVPSSSASASPPAATVGAPSPSSFAPWSPRVVATPTEPGFPDDTPTPPLPKGTLPSVKAAPAGPWTSIDWIALPGGHYPAVPQGVGAGDPNATLVGWHGGYIEFLWDPEAWTLTPWVSSNGLTWRTGTRMDLSAFAETYKGLQESDAEWTPEPSEIPMTQSCSFSEIQFEEGPSTLLLRGYLHCGDACSGGIQDLGGTAFWVSSDGLAWTPVDVAKAFGGEPDWISGGSAGFVTFNGARTKLLVSADGRSWSAAALPAGTNYSQPVALASGFVMGNAVVLVKGHVTGNLGGCLGGASDLAKYRAELWWSADGSSWTATHDGITGYGVAVAMTRLNDHLVVADEATYGSDNSITKEVELISTDGKSWTQLSGPLIDATVRLVGRDQGFLINGGGDEGYTLQTFDSSLRLVTIKETGDRPWDDIYPESWVIGPTGLLATADGERFWIGIPSAG